MKTTAVPPGGCGEGTDPRGTAFPMVGKPGRGRAAVDPESPPDPLPDAVVVVPGARRGSAAGSGDAVGARPGDGLGGGVGVGVRGAADPPPPSSLSRCRGDRL